MHKRSAIQKGLWISVGVVAGEGSEVCILRGLLPKGLYLSGLFAIVAFDVLERYLEHHTLEAPPFDVQEGRSTRVVEQFWICEFISLT